MAVYHSLQFQPGRLRILDQRVLPEETLYRDLTSVNAVVEAIQTLAIRGAPAIGAATAYGLVLAADEREGRRRLYQAAHQLRTARPTAVNLQWALDRVMDRVEAMPGASADDICRIVLDEANAIAQEDIVKNRALSRYGAELIPNGSTVIHYCNTGSLATVGYGTALGIIRAACEDGKYVHVYVAETRPLLQGARLTAWELSQLMIPYTLVVEGALAALMHTRRVDLCLVGCDRVAANGDVANKIGTYLLALTAHAHDIPFYVAVPWASVDLTIATGAEIAIEERDAREVTTIGGQRIAPLGAPVWNPAFDVTPASLITGLITEYGMIRPPFAEGLSALYQQITTGGTQ